MPTIMSLMKICEEKQYADCFLSGKLHSNRLGYFRDQDIDRYEGAIWQCDRGGEYQDQFIHIDCLSSRFTVEAHSAARHRRHTEDDEDSYAP